MNDEWLGWAASVILLGTLVGQVHAQWASRSTEGVSPWLFSGQLAASIGFAAYSIAIGNMVFLACNIALAATAIAGQVIFIRNALLAQSQQLDAQSTLDDAFANPVHTLWVPDGHRTSHR